MRAKQTALLLTVSMACAPAFGQEDTEAGWTAEVGLSAVAKTGDAETTDFGTFAKAQYENDIVRHFAEIVYDYGEVEGEESKNRLFGSYQQDRLLSDRWFAFAQGSGEVDEFSGYDYRLRASLGLGYDVLVGENATWSVRAGPGVQLDEIKEVIDPVTEVVTVENDTQTSFSVFAGSRYERQLNDAVTFNWNTDVTWTDETTTTFNGLALSADLMGNLAAKFSYDILYETDPPEGSEETNTTARTTLVYTLAK